MFSKSGERLVKLQNPGRTSKKVCFADVASAQDYLSKSHILEKMNFPAPDERKLMEEYSAATERIDLSFFKILVAEDNLINQKIVQKMLEKMGVSFKIVENGREVLESLRNEYFDLVLMDCYMKEMNGFEAAKAIRQCNERFVKIPIIAYSAGLFDTDRESIRHSGMNDFIMKPVTFEQLHSKIKEWVGRIYRALPVLDLRALEKIRIFDDGHHTLLRSLFQIYSENTQDELFKMRDLIMDGDIERLRRKAHMLKSSAAQLGAFRFEKFCILMEHDEELDMDRAKKLHVEMCQEYEKSRLSFFEYCRNLGQVSNVLM